MTRARRCRESSVTSRWILRDCPMHQASHRGGYSGIAPIHVTTANVTDRAGALAMFDQRRDGLSLVQNVLVDGGYTGDPFAAGVQSLLGASVEVVKRNEMQRMVIGDLQPGGWVEVQPGTYRYAVYQLGNQTLIRMLLRDYLACEVAWDEE